MCERILVDNRQTGGLEALSSSFALFLAGLSTWLLA
jgi:hypothetical protein